MFPHRLLLIAMQKCVYNFAVIAPSAAHYTNENVTKSGKYRFYPKNSVFLKSDLIDRGCVVFISNCPAAYKRNAVCGRHYDGYYKTFNNYCEMEYENCNGWRQWSMVKHGRC